MKTTAPSTRLHASALVGDENNLMLPNNAQCTVMMHNNNHCNIFEDDSESGDGLNVGNAMLLGLLFVQGALTFGPDDKIPQPRDPHQGEAVEQFKLRWKKNETIHEKSASGGIPAIVEQDFRETANRVGYHRTVSIDLLPSLQGREQFCDKSHNYNGR